MIKININTNTNIKTQSYPEAFIDDNYDFYIMNDLGFKTFEQFLAYKWNVYQAVVDYTLGRGTK